MKGADTRSQSPGISQGNVPPPGRMRRVTLKNRVPYSRLRVPCRESHSRGSLAYTPRRRACSQRPCRTAFGERTQSEAPPTGDSGSSDSLGQRDEDGPFPERRPGTRSNGSPFGVPLARVPFQFPAGVKSSASSSPGGGWRASGRAPIRPRSRRVGTVGTFLAAWRGSRPRAGGRARRSAHSTAGSRRSCLRARWFARVGRPLRERLRWFVHRAEATTDVPGVGPGTGIVLVCGLLGAKLDGHGVAVFAGHAL
jgi:hypothetical protein